MNRPPIARETVVFERSFKKDRFLRCTFCFFCLSAFRVLRVNQKTLPFSRMRKIMTVGTMSDDGIGNPFLLPIQGQGRLNRTYNMFSLEYSQEYRGEGGSSVPFLSLDQVGFWSLKSSSTGTSLRVSRAKAERIMRVCRSASSGLPRG